jgi:hypothetical protein
LLITLSASIQFDHMHRTQSRSQGVGRDDFGDCTPMSNRQFRRQQAAAGHSLAGREDDHIVPLAAGGARHPWNMRLIGRHTNRQWGPTWNRAKCQEVGGLACAKAVIASLICGTYASGVPTK